MAWPQNVQDEALVMCGRCCCLCHRFCGGKIELHHIRQKAAGGEYTLENCIPLCFDCHADAGHYNTGHPKGTKYSENELRAHRDRWFARIDTTQKRYGEPEIEIDRRIANDLHRLMMLTAEESRSVYWFLKEDSIWHAFHKSCSRRTHAVENFLDRPDSAFINADIESAKSSFHDLLAQANSMRSVLVGPAANPKEYAAKPHVMLSEEAYRALYREVQIADQVATKAAEAYEELFRVIRRELLIDLKFEVVSAEEV